jgi:hypothetical protein
LKKKMEYYKGQEEAQDLLNSFLVGNGKAWIYGMEIYVIFNILQHALLSINLAYLIIIYC